MAAAAGFSHSAAVSEDGSLFVWGRGKCGQLGTGDNSCTTAPTRVAGLPAPVRQVAAGNSHTGIVTDAGDLLMCGHGWDGQLGLCDKSDRTTPTLVERALFDDDAVLVVACGDAHTATVTEGGGVYTFGWGYCGRLGHGAEKDQPAPRRVSPAAFNDERVVMVAAGFAHTVALSEEGHVFTWGYGENGQLGHNDDDDQLAPRQLEPGRFGGEKVVFVAAGGRHTVAVTAWGNLYSWGNGGRGQLGLGSCCFRLVPTLVGAWAFGGTPVVMAACGYAHTLVVTYDGALWACGWGENGQLGLDDEPRKKTAFEQVEAAKFGGTRIVAAAAGRSHSAAVTEDGALWTWGAGFDGQLGHGDEDGRLVPALVPGVGFRGEKIGRGREPPAEHALAFAMGAHGRLGAVSPVWSLAGEVGLLRMIVRKCQKCRWVGMSAWEEDALVRLGGGGEMQFDRLESNNGLTDLPFQGR